MSVIFHIDVNSAYLSWTAVEQLKNGAKVDLRMIPSIIGGDQKSRHGVVLAKSLSAKKFGISTGEPVVNAFRKCPNLITARPDHELYSAYSKRLMKFLRSYTPDIEQVSVDECYMDFTQIAEQYVSPVEGALDIKNKVYEKFGFTVNIGVSTVKLLAKMASDFQKPNKVHTLFPEEIPIKMWPMPVRELYMAGRSSVEKLQKLEISTIGDLANTDPNIVEIHLKSHGRKLWEFANGIDDSQVETEQAEAKGIGNSTTLPKDAETEEEALKVLDRLAQSVGARLRKAGQKAGMLSVEIKYHDFNSCSHQKQLPKATSDDKMIFDTAGELFHELWDKEPVRLLGIRSSKLVEESEPEQLSIFDVQEVMGQWKEQQQKKKKRQEVDKALDRVRKKYGKDIVTLGTGENQLTPEDF